MSNTKKQEQEAIDYFLKRMCRGADWTDAAEHFATTCIQLGRQEARQAVEGKQNPYPADIFIKPTKEQYDKINSLVEQSGLSVDGYNGSWGRKVWGLCQRDGLEAIDDLIDDAEGRARFSLDRGRLPDEA